MKMNSWNPWHGCNKYSEGCDHCYMYYLDAQRDQDGSLIYKLVDCLEKCLICRHIRRFAD